MTEATPGPNDPTTAYPHHTASGGAAGTPCWFQMPDPPYIGTSGFVTSWEPIGTPGTDAIGDPDSGSQILIVTSGVYLLTYEASISAGAAGDPGDVQIIVKRNGSTILPLIDVGRILDADTKLRLSITAPVTLNANDLIAPRIEPQGVEITATDALLILMRLA